jgi:hypothetical protein
MTEAITPLYIFEKGDGLVSPMNSKNITSASKNRRQAIPITLTPVVP